MSEQAPPQLPESRQALADALARVKYALGLCVSSSKRERAQGRNLLDVLVPRLADRLWGFLEEREF